MNMCRKTSLDDTDILAFANLIDYTIELFVCIV